MIFLGAAIGIVAGFIGTWLIYHTKIQHAAELTKAETTAQLASLNEKLAFRERTLAEAKTALDESQGEMAQLREQLTLETAKRARAEQKCVRIPELDLELRAMQERESAARDSITQLEKIVTQLETRLTEERKQAEESVKFVNNAREKLLDTFKALSATALSSNNQSFLDLAKQTLQTYQEGAKSDLDKRQIAIDALVKPLKESLEKVDGNLKEIEKTRIAAYSTIKEQIDSLTNTQFQLRTETSNLVKALRTPQGRGRWGEMQLRRLVEVAGMVMYCDFEEQTQVETEAGRLRPDMIIHLPGGRDIIVDAKTPLLAYIESLETNDDAVRQAKLQQHAQQVRTHLDNLSGKAYWSQFKQTPEIVVMFLEAESIFSTALQGDPSLIQYGAEKQVIMATPTTLLALLRAVHYGWRQEQLIDNAQIISDLGKDLYERICKLSEHFSSVGKHLDSTVDSFNSAVGTLESRVLPGARKFKELGISTKADLKELQAIDTKARFISTDELLPPPDVNQ